MWRERILSQILEENSAVSVDIAIFHMGEDKNYLTGLQEKEADLEKQCKNLKRRGKFDDQLKVEQEDF